MVQGKALNLFWGVLYAIGYKNRPVLWRYPCFKNDVLRSFVYPNKQSSSYTNIDQTRKARYKFNAAMVTVCVYYAVTIGESVSAFGSPVTITGVGPQPA